MSFDINKLSVNQLVKILRKADEEYYSTGNPVMADEQYDNLVDKLRKLDPTNEYLNKVGTEKTNEMVKLPFKMTTLNKIKSEENDKLELWVKTYKGEYIVSDKLDGISCQLYMNKKRNVSLYLRGNYEYGKNISYLLKYLNIDISKIPNDVSIRGELIISKDNFKRISGYKNARNLVAGIVNAKTIDENIIKYVEYIAYAIMNPRYKQDEQMRLLVTYGMKVVNYDSYKIINTKILENKLEERRINSEYKVDGLVVIDNSAIYNDDATAPKYAFAFKYNNITIQANVVNIKWNISKDGYLKPVIEIEPVELEDVTITNITAYNAKYVVDNKLGIGSEIEIVRSGDVIPKIIRVITEGKIVYPECSYEWNTTQVDFITNDIECHDDILVKQMEHFFKTLDIKYLSHETIEKLVNNGNKSIIDILTANKEKLYNIAGLGKKSIDKIYNEIEKKMEKVELSKLMAASGLFGRNLGEKKLQLILDMIPNVITEKQPNKELLDRLLNINGIGKTNADEFIKGLGDFIKFYNILISKVKINFKQQEIIGTRFDKYVICFSGFRDNELKTKLISEGAKVVDDVTKSVTLLIVKDKNEESNKIQKARDRNIEIVELEEFRKKYKL